ncbi:MAG TPA: Na/Pi symporter [Lacibacter sp.]|nr:Na/Pi symporter [Lacibacter sp.]HMO89519.1 Na/Pi symporter [Lacibacter sp.]
MPVTFEYWKLLAGAAIFLLGINLLEEALKMLTGRRFKLFLKKQTGHKLKAIAGGTVVTAFMQSSSVVNLLVLSMVGAGILKMQNALAVMLGSNLGTTFTGWVVATFGFKFNIEAFSLPLLAVAGLLVMVARPQSTLFYWCRFFIGFAFLFLGLDYMKTGMVGFVEQTDLSRFAGYPLLFFVGVGLVLTALVQSSSVTIALTLSALHARAIDLPMAAAIVLGAEIGTTLKLALASVQGVAAKKRVALGNILFNTINTVLILLLLRPVLYLITDLMGMHDSLYALVFFQSFLNLTGILLFLPFLNIFGRFLENRFRDEPATEYLHKISVQDSDLATEALENETRHFVHHFLAFGSKALALAPGNVATHPSNGHFEKKNTAEMYATMKALYGELHAFYIRLQNTMTRPAETQRIDQLSTCIRNVMYAAKSLKDALPDMDQFRQSSNDVKFGFFQLLQERMRQLVSTSAGLLQNENKEACFLHLSELYKQVQADYAGELRQLYQDQVLLRLTKEELTTLLNLNRALVTSSKSLIFGLKDLLLTHSQAAYFEELPGFIR